MALNPLRPRLRNISNAVAKVQVNLAAGDEIEVSEDVAAQIAHQGAPLSAAAPAVPAAPVEADEPVKPKARTRKAKG